MQMRCFQGPLLLETCPVFFLNIFCLFVNGVESRQHFTESAHGLCRCGWIHVFLDDEYQDGENLE